MDIISLSHHYTVAVTDKQTCEENQQSVGMEMILNELEPFIDGSYLHILKKIMHGRFLN